LFTPADGHRQRLELDFLTTFMHPFGRALSCLSELGHLPLSKK
jgi:hypothetical protein